MERKILSWNSRTKDENILNDKDFKAIVKFIKNRDPNSWIFGFYSYDNEETEKFINKLVILLKDSKDLQDSKNLYWLTEKIVYPEQDAVSSYEKILKKIEKEVKEGQSGIVALFEPIDFASITHESLQKKYYFHKKLIEQLSGKHITLFLFENINFDLEYYGMNSPLQKFVKFHYQIPGYRIEEIDILKHLRDDLGEKIIKYCDGQSQIISDLEMFWKDISLEHRLIESINNFIDIPIQTFLSKIVRRKLIKLSGFLENIGDSQYIINYNEEHNIVSIEMGKEQNFIKNQFLKTGLFDCNIKTVGLTSYELTPKKIFESAIEESGFISNKGKMKSPSENDDKYSDTFSEIATYFIEATPIFILGAGNSLTSGAPDRKRMFQHILKTIYSRKKSQFDNMSYEELKKEFQGLIDSGYRKDSLLFLVRNQLNALKPSVGHFHLSQLVKAGRVNVFITTNFDTLLEDSLMDYGIRSKAFVRLVAKGKKMASNEWKWVNKFPGLLKIFKICGDIYYGSSMAVDDNTANIWIDSGIAALDQVTVYRESDFFIILGHKFEEIDLNKIFDNKPEGGLTVIYANPDESDCEIFKNKCGHKCSDLKLISGYYGEFDNFMQELLRCLREINLL